MANHESSVAPTVSPTVGFVIKMLRGHAQREHHCQDGETTRALRGDFRWIAAALLEQFAPAQDLILNDFGKTVAASVLPTYP